MVAALYDDLATELGLLDRAEAAADTGQRALELWRTAGDRLREGDSTRRLSGMMRSLCRGQDAEAAAQTAVAILESLAPGVEMAQAYANLAAQEMLTGRYEAAIETARRAQSLADLASAPQVLSDALNSEAVAAAIFGREWTGLLERALQIALAEGLRSIPAGPRSATRENPLGLTRREREVLDLIRAGQTNAAIAATLFISAKTVDHHVSAVLAKLGAPNRNAAAAQAARLGLTR